MNPNQRTAQLAKELLDTRELLEELVAELSQQNQPDQLGGYHNSLGDSYNERLRALALPQLEQVEVDED